MVPDGQADWIISQPLFSWEVFCPGADATECAGGVIIRKPLQSTLRNNEAKKKNVSN